MKNDLMDEISGMEVSKYHSSAFSWHEALKKTRPKEYQQMIEVIKDWGKGGLVRKKIRSKAALYRFLSGNNPKHRIDPPLVTCKYDSFSKFVTMVNEEGE